MLKNQVRVFKFAANHDIKKRFEACHSNFGMLVNKGCEKGSTHDFTKMDELLISTDSKLLHTLAAFDDDLACRIHADCSQDIDNLLCVRPHTVKDS